MSATTLETPPPRGLSRLRRNKGNQSSSSLISSSSGDAGGGLKATLSNAMDKVRKSVDERRESTGDLSPKRRLSKMFSRNKHDDDAQRSSQQVGDAGELSQVGLSSNASLEPPSRRSSLLTDDGAESLGVVRPTLSAHSSHHGFLTLSSPAVNTRAETEEPSTEPSIPIQLDTAILPSIVEPETSLTRDDPSVAPLLPSHKKSVSAVPALQTVPVDSSKEELGHTSADRPVSLVDAVPTDRPETPVARLRITTEPDTPPNKVSTPDTFVTPPTPVLDQNARSVSPVRSTDGSIRRRRALSGGQPSKLSKSIPAPLTPTVEEAKTPGGTAVQPNQATGFFSSVFSAAQKAADQLSSTIAVPGVTKSKEAETEATPEKAPVLAASPDMGSTTDLSKTQPVESEKEAAARAVSNAYEKPAPPANGRPVSVASTDRLAVNGSETPPRQADGEDLKRTGSVRSRFSARRHRGSSAATGTGIGAGLKESASGLQHVSSQGHRMTGFAVASKKRNKDFHQQFRSVPEDDYLIEDYSAALQRDILLHGRLYVSEGHICFSSNILGWVTNLVMSFDEIVSVEKKSTAVIFPNAIVISTVSARNTFASFVARDSTYELIIGIWKINHPHLKSSLGGVALENAGTGDKTEKAESVASSHSDTESDEFYDEDAEDDDKPSYVEGDTTKSVENSDNEAPAPAAKPSAPAKTAAPTADAKSSPDTKAKEIVQDPAANTSAASSDGVGPETHAPTECGDESSHYDRPLIDATIPAPLGKVYSLMWGPASGAFMSKWLVEDQKSRELELKDDKTGLDNEHKTFSFSYIKPLGGSIGPKQTHCHTTNTLEQFDLEKAVTVGCSTQTPDVPSGNVFLTKTRYCLTWAAGNQTRLVANCTIEWSGRSFLKGPIEKGAQDGQTQYAKDIVAALKAATSSKPATKPGAKKGKKKGKREEDEDTKEETKPAPVADSKTDWGLLEPIHGIVEPVLDLVRPFLSPQVTIAVLFVLLMYTWYAPPNRNVSVGFPGYSSPDRIAAYEQLWQREETELWDWLEDRVGLDQVHAAKLDDRKTKQKSVVSKKLGKQIADERMDELQLDEAIKVTQERLDALKNAVGRKKDAVSGQT